MWLRCWYATWHYRELQKVRRHGPHCLLDESLVQLIPNTLTGLRSQSCLQSMHQLATCFPVFLQAAHALNKQPMHSTKLYLLPAAAHVMNLSPNCLNIALHAAYAKAAHHWGATFLM
jgi:hypothetical protein